MLVVLGILSLVIFYVVFIYSLCKVSADSDRKIEELMRKINETKGENLF